MQNQRLSELFGIPAELLADKDDARMLKYVVTLLKDPESFLAKVDYLYKHPHDTSRDEIELKNGKFLDRYSSPVIDKNGTYYGRIWTFRDITERKRNEDVLQQRGRAESCFRRHYRSERQDQLREPQIHRLHWVPA